MTLYRIKETVKKATKSKFVRNVVVVASGTAAAQAITMAFAPVITRIYGPEAFGLLGVFMALVAILTPVAALTYPIAIVLPKEDSDAIGLAKLSFFIALILTALAAVVLLAGGERLLGLLDSEVIAPYMMLIPLSMLCAACMQIAQQWLIRKKQFSITARVAVLQAFILNSAKTGIGWLHPVGAVLVMLATAGQALYAAMLWMGIKKSRTLPENQAGERTSLRDLAKKHRDFAVYRAPESLLSAATSGLPVLLLASLVGPKAAGFYSLAKMSLKLPNVLLIKSIGDVFYPRIAKAKNNNEAIFKLTLKATFILAAVAFTPYFFVVLFGPQLFSLVFGEDWLTAGKYAQFISFWLFFAICTAAVIKTLTVLNLQGFFLMYRVSFVALSTMALYIGFRIFQSELMAVAIYSIVNAASCLLLIAFVLMKAKNSDYMR